MGISSKQDHKKNNRKAELEGREVEMEKNVVKAPSGLNMNIPLELPIIKNIMIIPSSRSIFVRLKETLTMTVKRRMKVSSQASSRH